MKTPKFTDEARYPHGYKPANQTDVKATFARVIEEQRKNAEERLRKTIAIRARKA